MAHVLRDNGSLVAVQNLAWVQRHAAEARTISIHSNGIDGNEATLLVAGNGWLFYSPFASLDVLRGWIARRQARSMGHVKVWENTHISVTLADIRQLQAGRQEARS